MTDTYEVEAIIGRRVFRGKEKYRVKWQNFSEEESTWEPIENLQDCLDLVAEFNEQQNIQSKKGKILSPNGNVFLKKYTQRDDYKLYVFFVYSYRSNHRLW